MELSFFSLLNLSIDYSTQHLITIQSNFHVLFALHGTSTTPNLVHYKHRINLRPVWHFHKHRCVVFRMSVSWRVSLFKCVCVLHMYRTCACIAQFARVRVSDPSFQCVHTAFTFKDFNPHASSAPIFFNFVWFVTQAHVGPLAVHNSIFIILGCK